MLQNGVELQMTLDEYVRFRYIENNHKMTICSKFLWTVSIYTLRPYIIINIFLFCSQKYPQFVRYILESP